MVAARADLALRVFCGFTATGKENVPKKGPVVIVPNHKSFWDPFFVAIVLRRPVHFMGKAEHFEGRWRGIFLRLGCLPGQARRVRRRTRSRPHARSCVAATRWRCSPRAPGCATRAWHSEARRRPAGDRGGCAARPDHHHRHREAALAAAAQGPHRLRRAGPGRGAEATPEDAAAVDRPGLAADHRGVHPVADPAQHHRRGCRGLGPGRLAGQEEAREVTGSLTSPFTSRERASRQVSASRSAGSSHRAFRGERRLPVVAPARLTG